MAAAKRKIEVAEDMFVWTEECYTMNEIGQKFGENYPPYMSLEQGDFRLESWQSVDPGEVLHIHSRIIQKRLEAKFVHSDGELLSIPSQCSLKVQVLPPRRDDPDHVYKSVAELVKDFPPQAKVVKTSGRNSLLNTGDLLSLKALETIPNPKGSCQILVGKCGNQDIRLPMDYKADFVFQPDGCTYTPYEVLKKFPAKQRVKFVEGIPTDYVSQELLRECRHGHSRDEVILLRIYEQTFYVCTFEPVDINDTDHISYRDEVMFLPGDERGEKMFVLLPMGTVPVPDPAIKLRRSDIVKLADRLIIEQMNEDMLLVEARDILKSYPQLPGERPTIIPRASLAQADEKGVRGKELQYIISTQSNIYETPSEDLSGIYGTLQPAKRPEGSSQKRSNQKGIPPPLPARNSGADDDSDYEVPDSPIMSRNKLPVASVPATVRQPPPVPSRMSRYHSGQQLVPPVPPVHQSDKKTIDKIEDIPKALDDLGVEEICQCLKVLKMDNAAKAFRENLLDGSMLMNMDLTVLAGDPINLKPLEIEQIKALKRGWRPKL